MTIDATPRVLMRNIDQPETPKKPEPGHIKRAQMSPHKIIEKIAFQPPISGWPSRINRDLFSIPENMYKEDFNEEGK